MGQQRAGAVRLDERVASVRFWEPRATIPKKKQLR